MTQHLTPGRTPSHATFSQGRETTPNSFEAFDGQTAEVPFVHQSAAAVHPHQPAEAVYGAHPAALQPGGAGPMAGMAPAQAASPQATPSQGSMPESVPSLEAVQAFQHPVARPAFPAAPSKVLAEQQALGGDGHIRQTDETPAFDTPMPIQGAQASALLEGTYPQPGSTPAHHPDEAPLASSGVLPHSPMARPGPPSAQTPPLSPSRFAQGQAGEAGPSPRARPRLQHADPSLHAQMAGFGEPNMAEVSEFEARASTAAFATGDAREGAFWGYASPRERKAKETGNTPWLLIALAMVVLLCLLAFGAWSQWRTPAALNETVRIEALPGPERIVPADPGGLQVENQDLGILNPEVRSIPADNTLIQSPEDLLAIWNPPAVAIPGVEEATQNTAGNTSREVAAESRVPSVQVINTDASSTSEASNSDLGSAVNEAPASEGVSAALQPDLVPQPRPVAIPTRQALPERAQQNSPATVPAPTSGPADARLVAAPPTSLYVQEGAYGSLETAQSAFNRLQGQAGTLLSNISPLYHRVEVRGQTFYRLYLTGFDSAGQAASIAVSLGRNNQNWLINNG